MDVVLPQDLIGDEEEADISTWLVEENATVSEGQEIAELETSKVLVQLLAPASGVLVDRLPEGTLVHVNERLASIR